MPSIEAMLITFAGCSGLAAAFSAPWNACTMKKGDLRFRFITLSQPLSGNSSNGALQAAPALLTRMSSLGSASLNRSARAFTPSTVDTSCGMEMQLGPSSAAVASQAAGLRELM